LVGGVWALVLLSACAGEPSDSGISWSLDSTCAEPSDADRAALEEGLALWSDGFGVDIVHDDHAAATHVSVCFSDEPIGHNGLATRTGPDSYRIQLCRRCQRFSGRLYAGLVAHEFGHVVLRSSDHLADGAGIMASGHDCAGDSAACEWSDADYEFIGSQL
jgi:hypothetical protein